MSRVRLLTSLLLVPALLLQAGIAGHAQAAVGATPPVTHVDHGPNAPLQQAKHYVVLVSLEGFRWDYVQKYGAHGLLAIAVHGASAPEGMLPSYPAEMLPNQYTLVTGLYPEHHGIVADGFFSEDGTRSFHADEVQSESDGNWYGGVPLWALAEQQGMRTACFGWPGADALISGTRPSDYFGPDVEVPDAARVELVLAAIKRPEAERPHFVAVSLAGVSRAAVQHGPESPEARGAVVALDGLLAKLRDGLAALHLPVDLIVVSDHGLAATQGGWINLDQYADLATVKTVSSLLYAGGDGAAQQVYDRLKIVDARFVVYRRANLPKELHFSSNARAGDPVIVPSVPVAIRAHAPAAGQPDPPPPAGSAGYDPRQIPEMRGIFYAEGPDIRPGRKLKPFENIHVFPLVSGILALEHGPIDGSAAVLSSVLVGDH